MTVTAPTSKSSVSSTSLSSSDTSSHQSRALCKPIAHRCRRVIPAGTMFSSLIVKISVLSMGTLCLYSSMQSNLPNYIKADIAAPVLEPVVNNLRRSTLALTAGADVRHEQESPASLRSQVTGDAMKYKSTHSGESLSYRVEISDSSENALPSGFGWHQMQQSKSFFFRTSSLSPFNRN